MSYCLRHVKLRFLLLASFKQIPQGWIEDKDEFLQSFCHCVRREDDYDFKKFFNEWNLALNDS